MNKIIRISSGPVLFLLTLMIGDHSDIQVKMIAIALWMLSWWISAALPIGVTALLPILLYPLLDILSLKATTANYAHPVIYLFFGGFVLGLAIEKWKLHERIALNILKVSGEKPSRIILGAMLATSLLSMWISNTATTVMMLPIGISIIQLLKNKLSNEKQQRYFALAILLGIAYSANIGGIATLIGTPPNLVLASILEEQNLTSITFSNWMIFAFPLTVLLFLFCYIVLNKLFFSIRNTQLAGVQQLMEKELRQLGKMSTNEKRVLGVLGFTALLWIFRSVLTQIEFLEHLTDTIIAILAVFLLFLIPNQQKTNALLEWKDTKKLPWDILLLFGGGLSLAKGLEVSEIVNVLGDWIGNYAGNSMIIIVLLVTLFALFLTEIMSNVALVAVFVPVAIVIAQSMGYSELQLTIPLTIAASCAFMFPISTPPNAIVFSSGLISMKQMTRAGIVLNLISVVLITIYSYYLIPMIFGN